MFLLPFSAPSAFEFTQNNIKKNEKQQQQQQQQQHINSLSGISQI